jgi:hypothetical protein
MIGIDLSVAVTPCVSGVCRRFSPAPLPCGSGELPLDWLHESFFEGTLQTVSFCVVRSYGYE